MAEEHVNGTPAASGIKNSVEYVAGTGHEIVQAGSVRYNKKIFNFFVAGDLTNSFKDLRSILGENGAEGEGEDEVDETDEDINGIQKSTEEKIAEEIAASSHETVLENAPGTQGIVGAIALPHTNREIENWYYRDLQDWERCFVNTCAILHGGTLRTIREATREISASLREKSQESPDQALGTPHSSMEPDPQPAWMPDALAWSYALGQQAERIRNMQTPPNPAEDTSPSSFQDQIPPGFTQILEKTHTYIERVNGALRVFWQGTEASGFSRFSMELLQFLAVGDLFGTQTDQHFFDIVEQWPAKYRGERAWRSARALGIIWWYQDARNLLSQRANKWVKSRARQDWYQAAALLEGAYQVEHDTSSSNAGGGNSTVLQLLDKWTSLAHQATTKRGEGYAVARTYTLIGRKYPEIALQGLDQLLRFPSVARPVQNGSRDPLEDLFIFSVVKYVDIAKSGHLRAVLKHLAHGANLSMDTQKYSRAQVPQNAPDLHTILTAFFLLTSCSLSAVDLSLSPIYSATQHLPAQPVFPDNRGRDILLTGLLTATESDWQDQLALLLCSIVLSKGKEYQAAIYLLSRWGEIVCNEQGAQDLYAQFLVKVGKLILKQSTGQKQTAIGIYTYQLSLWQTTRKLPQPFFKNLAQKVLDQFPQTR